MTSRRKDPRIGLAQPRARQAKTERIIIRIESVTKARLIAEAERLEMTLTAWATEALELALARGGTR